MSQIGTIPVTAALKQDYALMHALVGVRSLDWIVILTNPACEERAMKSLASAGLITYRPMEPVTRRRRRASKTIDASRPFFPRYLFVALDRSASQYAETVRECDGVENILTFHFDKRPHVVPAREMRAIMEAAWKAQTDQEYQVPQSFSIGEQIHITTPHYQRLEAFVSGYHEAKGMVTAEADMMGQSVRLLVPVDKCQKVR